MTTRDRRSNAVVRRLARLLPAACAALVAFASSQPASAAGADFSGGWSVAWCDRTNPKLDCGGFNITLVQDGERICGDFGGALVNLRQTDEGRVIGTAVGKTAVLTVQSQRNGSIALVRATLRGDGLHWKVVDEVRRGDNQDIDIVALDDTLTRQQASPHSDGSSEARPTCDAPPRKSGG